MEGRLSFWKISAVLMITLLAGSASNAQSSRTPPQGDIVRGLGLQDILGDSSATPVADYLNPEPSPTPLPFSTVDNSIPAAAAQTNAPPSVDGDWHLIVAPYLWLTGVHGTIGAFDREVGIHASIGDLLSHFRFGLMGLVEPRYKRLVLPLDIIWARLGDNRAVPLNEAGVTTANIKGGEFILTPKIGYEVIDQEKFKVDFLAGFRYWHFYQDLHFTPSVLGLNFSQSQNWVDPLVGGRIQALLSPKVRITIDGDVGGWGAGSQLDYQVVGLLGYQIKPNWILQTGYRYLYVDYRNGAATVKLTTSGVLIGVALHLK
jgi:hypothetical protein